VSRFGRGGARRNNASSKRHHERTRRPIPEGVDWTRTLLCDAGLDRDGTRGAANIGSRARRCRRGARRRSVGRSRSSSWHCSARTCAAFDYNRNIALAPGPAPSFTEEPRRPGAVPGPSPRHPEGSVGDVIDRRRRETRASRWRMAAEDRSRPTPSLSRRQDRAGVSLRTS